MVTITEMGVEAPRWDCTPAARADPDLVRRVLGEELHLAREGGDARGRAWWEIGREVYLCKTPSLIHVFYSCYYKRTRVS